jgi:hypothetical protein
VILMAYLCSICEEESTRICARCTKDTCANHLCERCASCSDCCECEVPLREAEENHSVLTVQEVYHESVSDILDEDPSPPPEQ